MSQNINQNLPLARACRDDVAKYCADATPSNASLLRLSVSAAHTVAQIDEALDIFAEVGRRLGFLPGDRRRAAGAL